MMVDCNIVYRLKGLEFGRGKRTNMIVVINYNDVGSMASGLNRNLAKRMDF